MTQKKQDAILDQSRQKLHQKNDQNILKMLHKTQERYRKLIGNVKFIININLVSKSFHWLLTILKFCLCYKMLQTIYKNVTVSKNQCD